MKVLVSDFHLGWGGQPAYLLNAAIAMREQVETHFLLPTGSELAGRARDAGLTCHEGELFAAGSQLAPAATDVGAALEVIDQERPAVVQVNGYLDQLPVALAARLSPVRPRVFKLKHNSFPTADHWFVRYAYGYLFDHVGLVAAGLKRQIEEVFRLNRRSLNEVTVHHGGVHVAMYHSGLDRPSRGDGVLSFGTVCRLAPEKGLDVLVRAFANVRRRELKSGYGASRLIIVGDGPSRAVLQRLICELGVGQAVDLVGYQHDVRPWLDRMDAFVLASVDCEGSSLALKEAMANPLPVISTVTGGAHEIVEHGVDGLLVPAADEDALAQAMIALAASQSLRRTLAAAALSRVERDFTVGQMAESLLDVYRLLSHQR